MEITPAVTRLRNNPDLNEKERRAYIGRIQYSPPDKSVWKDVTNSPYITYWEKYSTVLPPTEPEKQEEGWTAYLLSFFGYGSPTKSGRKRNTPTAQKIEEEAQDRQERVRNPAPYRPAPVVIGEPKLQPSASLLYKLPLELRQEIFRHVVGDSGIRLVGSYFRWFYSCECVAEERSLCGDAHGTKANVGLNRLHFLLSCRQIYTESIDLLYTANTFCLRQADPLMQLPLLLVTQRLHQIRSLNFEYSLFNAFMEAEVVAKDDDPEAERDWHRVWRVMAGMQGLRSLFVELTLSGFWDAEKFAVNEPYILAPVRKLTTPLTEFRFRVPYQSAGSVEVGGKTWRIESSAGGMSQE
ncbi:hypothetical protein BU16DRAFT_611851 [Lophium mytilinum]|uniref:DUF7730 domain-containing protein n=1 Tax=Lophium mytilinum TaxID=390894 RepID=A0A6A6REA5_9PEZI|nr:hypothetical protein BU16DRAFT_611851 [Lophium mytilinum]